MSSQLTISPPHKTSFTSLPPPPPMSPRCEECHRKESCLCDKESEFDMTNIFQNSCVSCGVDAIITGTNDLCADCYTECQKNQEEDEDYDWPYKGNCTECGDNILMTETHCADCYWEEDSKRKWQRREFYSRNPELLITWRAHCRYILYSQEPIEVSEFLLSHIPNTVLKDSEEYTTYVNKFKKAIQEGIHSMIDLLKEINPNYEPK
jgi:hypothetical protein